MTLFQFEVLCSAVEEGSFTKAGEKLGLTQPAVSHAIKSLEEELEISLLSRGRSGVFLTSDGKRIIGYIRQVLDLKKQIQQESSAINGLDVGSIRLGIFPSISAKILPIVLENFKKTYPSIKIELIETDQDKVRDGLNSGSIDVGFITILTNEAFRTTPIFQDDFVVVRSNEYPAKDEQFDLQSISTEPFIMPKGGCATSILKILKRSGIKPDVHFEIQDIATILAMVRNKVGWSVVPETYLMRQEAEIRTVKLEGETYRTIGLATPPQNRHSPAVQAFLQIVVNAFKK